VETLWVSQAFDNCREKCRKHRHILPTPCMAKKALLSSVTYSDLPQSFFGKRGALCRSDIPRENLVGRLEGCLFRASSKGDAGDMRSRTLSVSVEDGKYDGTGPERRQPQIAGTASVEEIRQRAYEIHLERGGVHGWDQDDWLQAEREIAKKHPAS
jgi:hypothetical protein